MGIATFRRLRSIKEQEDGQGQNHESAEETGSTGSTDQENDDDGRQEGLLNLIKAGEQSPAFQCPKCGKDCKIKMAYTNHVKACKG